MSGARVHRRQGHGSRFRYGRAGRWSRAYPASVRGRPQFRRGAVAHGTCTGYGTDQHNADAVAAYQSCAARRLDRTTYTAPDNDQRPSSHATELVAHSPLRTSTRFAATMTRTAPSDRSRSRPQHSEIGERSSWPSTPFRSSPCPGNSHLNRLLSAPAGPPLGTGHYGRRLRHDRAFGCRRRDDDGTNFQISRVASQGLRQRRRSRRPIAQGYLLGRRQGPNRFRLPPQKEPQPRRASGQPAQRFRRVATRFDKTAVSFLSFIAVLWPWPGQPTKPVTFVTQRPKPRRFATLTAVCGILSVINL